MDIYTWVFLRLGRRAVVIYGQLIRKFNWKKLAYQFPYDLSNIDFYTTSTLHLHSLEAMLD